MQSNASNLELDRQRRLAEADSKEQKTREEDDKVRSQKGRFVSGLHREAEKMDLGDSLRRRAKAGSFNVDDA